MQLPVEKRLQFFVYVVESPSAPDLYHDRTEADFIRKAVLLNGIPCIRRTVINGEAFGASLAIGLREEMEKLPNRIPILHVSAHGSKAGIQLSSGEILTWEALRQHLVPINQALKGTLLVCMSTCEGYSGTQMAMDENPDAEHPYIAIVGNGEAPTWPETAVGFATFYHQLALGYQLEDAVNAMRVASGNNNFYVEWGSTARQNYIEYVKTLNTTEAANELRSQETQEDKPADAKFTTTSSERDAVPA